MLATDNIDILLVEDNPADVFVLKKMLQASSLHINSLFTTHTVIEAQEALKTHQFDLTLLDLSLPDSFGIETYLGIRSSAQKIPVIILTGLNDADTAVLAIKHGAQDYLVKGKFNEDLLCRAILYSLERKKAEEALLVSEEKYKQMFYQNIFPSLIYDPASSVILEVNDAAIKAYGYSRDEFLTLKLKDIRVPGASSKLLKAGPNREGQIKLWKHKKKNGETMICEVAFFPINYLGQKASQAQMHDVTQEVKLQQRLTEQQKAEQKKITAAVLKALECDRSHLGAELHDNINQILATGMLYLEHAQNNVDLRDHLINQSLQVVSLAIEEIRKLSRTLIIRDITEIGLKRSVEEMIASIRSVKAMQITLQMDAFSEYKVEEDVKITIYRIIQEQLTNILKHADASCVTIELKKEVKEVTLEICDNGKGFDTMLPKKGVGITNMNSRVSLYDGEVKIESAPDKGCTLKVMLHLNK